MKARLLICLLFLSLSAPVFARPVRVVVPHRVSSWTRAWHGFIDFFSGFQIFDGGHTLPPPSTTTLSNI